jgi:hypothetical protein
MGTRGAFGVFSDGTLKMTYNHYDSYPSGLGVQLAEQIADMATRNSQESFKGLAAALTVIDPDTKPTAKQIKKLAPWTDLGVSEQSTSDWYCLTRNLQGDLKAILEDAGYMSDGSDFPADSLFCEWAYVFDIDNMKLEVYKGFQTKPHTKGRFASMKVAKAAHPFDETYYPVKLTKVFDVDKDLVANVTKYSKRAG